MIFFVTITTTGRVVCCTRDGSAVAPAAGRGETPNMAHGVRTLKLPTIHAHVLT
jgi:hypothetical protein